MIARDSEEKLAKARKVVDQFRNFGIALYTYQDFADDFNLPEERVLQILNEYNNDFSKNDIIAKLVEIKSD